MLSDFLGIPITLFYVLINSLSQVDVDIVPIEAIWFGGVNEDWSVEDHPDAVFSPKE